MSKKPYFVRGFGLVRALQGEGADIQKFHWKLTTGRLPTNVEWGLMKHLKARTIGDVWDTVQSGREWLTSLSSTPVSELIQKRWMTKGDIAMAKRLAKIAGSEGR